MKIKIAVLFGGKSVEHEISIISAVQAMRSLNREKYEIIPVYITKNNEMYTGDDLFSIEEYTNFPSLINKCTRVTFAVSGNRTQLVKCSTKLFEKNLVSEIDLAFPIVHGTNCEDGTLHGFLKMFNLPLVGCDVTASAVGMDKYIMKTVFRDNAIPVLDCRCFTRAQYEQSPESAIEKTEKAIEYPVIVKPVNLGSSVGIKKASDRNELAEALENAFNFAGKVLVEKAVQNLKEINCSVLGDCDEAAASECEEPVNSDEILSYEDKYISGGKGSKVKGSKGGSKGMASLKRKIPAEISEEQREYIRSLAVKAFRCLGCSGVARIDFMMDLDEEKIYLNEINTIPGSLSFYLWEPLGIGYKELLDRILTIAVKRQTRMQNVVHSFETNVLSGAVLGRGSKG